MVNNKDITFGLVQLPVVKGSIEQNFKTHQKYIELAAQNGADIVVFPELSLTGYEPQLASKLAVNIDSPVVKLLSAVAKKNDILIVSGCPIQNSHSRPFIGSIISYPTGHTDFYRKQHLHTGEAEFFDVGTAHYFIHYQSQVIALAICADFSNSNHPAKAKAAGASVYLSSVLVSDNGFDVDCTLLQHYASEHNLAVLMSNHNGRTGSWKGCGKSRAWDRRGRLSIASHDDSASLILCVVSNREIQGEVLKI
ncbi:carbon-nitrogen hydrolase family protein [Moritella sp. 24]|uniref:carbon-nitrogen hydrolase family protein n=1 Tax=Moritella sp. 24 TaxID=2746230 RepID=UPI001BAB0EA3|nr:carbon-nitrogen hydrolase family protein [Moritella sp. 24]QUM76913.1 carbon-nitrogen hydrolase family protein [Moritella sp. 24]